MSKVTYTILEIPTRMLIDIRQPVLYTFPHAVWPAAPTLALLAFFLYAT